MTLHEIKSETMDEIFEFLEKELLESMNNFPIETNNFWTDYEEHIRPYEHEFQNLNDIDIDVQYGWYRNKQINDST